MGVWGSILLVLVRMSYVIFGTERGSDERQELGQHETPLSCVRCPCLPFDPLCGHSFPGSSCFLHPHNLSLHAVADLASLALPALQPYPHGSSTLPPLYSESQEQEPDGPISLVPGRPAHRSATRCPALIQLVMAEVGLGSGVYTWLPRW